jgi:hypothetical protein
MARKRKHHHVARRRRSVGAASGITGLLMKAAGLAGGVFAGGMIAKTVSTLDPKILGGGLLLGGVFLANKAKNPLLEGVGFGLAAKGANNLLTSMGMITGMGSVPLIGYRNMPKLQNSVGQAVNPGTMRNPIGGVRDLSAIGALYDN